MAIIAHETSYDPFGESNFAIGYMQTSKTYWKDYVLDGKQYSANHPDLYTWGSQNGATYNDDYASMVHEYGNISVGIATIREQAYERGGMWEGLKAYTGSSDDRLTQEILYLRDFLANEAGSEQWFSIDDYSSYTKENSPWS